MDHEYQEVWGDMISFTPYYTEFSERRTGFKLVNSEGDVFTFGDVDSTNAGDHVELNGRIIGIEMERDYDS